MSSNGAAPKLLTVSAAARRTGIPASAIRKALEDKHLTYVQPNGPGGWKLIPPKELARWLDKVTVKAKEGA
jgi:excisionase family DNA binding protein